MKKVLLLLLWCALPCLAQVPSKMPYAQAGLNERQAAAHLLSRFTFGATPGEVDRVVEMGLDKWFEEQLAARDLEVDLQRRLLAYRSLDLSDRDLNRIYLYEFVIGDLAAQSKEVPKPTGEQTDETRKAYHEALVRYAQEHQLRFVQEEYQEMLAQKVIRAVYSKNQLWEVMCDFWFNHFNVSVSTDARPFLLSYERDAIRPYAMGRVLPLLMKTAKHPAMLVYLNNAQSVANADMPTSLDMQMNLPKKPSRNNKAGLNENYAREVMELHTLGVDGGYNQHDVTELARALTGWTYYPMDPRQQKQRTELDSGRVRGAVIQGDFVFRGDHHDAAPKRILGRDFPAGGGLAEGEAALAMLVSHPATAHHISRQLAQRFVSDNPPESLVNRMAETFRKTQGDTREILRTLAHSPEFWSAQARRAKIKSPFELVVSSLRALDAEVEPGGPLNGWLERMGQPLYAYAPPTGFPDRADTWINSGTLLYRMNYGLSLAAGQIRGVKIDLSSLGSVTQGTAQELQRVASLLMPERDLGDTVKDLAAQANDPDLAKRLAQANAKPAALGKPGAPTPARPGAEAGKPGAEVGKPGSSPGKATPSRPAPAPKPPTMSQIVGVLIGSPEFQRR